jgi:hypothetical protein
MLAIVILVGLQYQLWWGSPEKSKGDSRLEASPENWDPRPANLQATPEKKA